jgi:hypothetical protein
MRPARAAVTKPVVLSRRMNPSLAGKLERLVMFRRIALDSNKSQ